VKKINNDVTDEKQPQKILKIFIHVFYIAFSFQDHNSSTRFDRLAFSVAGPTVWTLHEFSNPTFSFVSFGHEPDNFSVHQRSL